jgi:hypothetical protein
MKQCWDSHAHHFGAKLVEGGGSLGDGFGALVHRWSPEGLVHHFHRGVHYASAAYRAQRGKDPVPEASLSD